LIGWLIGWLGWDIANYFAAHAAHSPTLKLTTNITQIIFSAIVKVIAQFKNLVPTPTVLGIWTRSLLIQFKVGGLPLEQEPLQETKSRSKSSPEFC
jgi:hypothetical protein